MGLCEHLKEWCDHPYKWRWKPIDWAWILICFLILLLQFSQRIGHPCNLNENTIGMRYFAFFLHKATSINSETGQAKHGGQQQEELLLKKFSAHISLLSCLLFATPITLRDGCPRTSQHHRPKPLLGAHKPSQKLLVISPSSGLLLCISSWTPTALRGWVSPEPANWVQHQARLPLASP